MNDNPAPSHELLDLLGGLCNETLTPEQLQRLQQLLKDNPAAQRTYLSYLDLHLALRRNLQQAGETCTIETAGLNLAADPLSHRSRSQDPRSLKASLLWGTALVATTAIVAVLAMLPFRQPADPVAAKQEPAPKTTVPVPQPPRIVQMAGARFIDAPVRLQRNSVLAFRVQYCLTEGQVELQFKEGARAILEAPAVFEVIEEDCLSVAVGRCSVHAPTGAEGFRVTTPTAAVVDLGTRFSVDVTEIGATEVQVVEGLAEVHQKAGPLPELVQLAEGEARQYPTSRSEEPSPVPFDRSKYVARLPDRIATFEATRHETGVRDLLSVTAQRGGKLYTYEVDQMIGVELIHFRGGKNSNALVCDASGLDPCDNPGDRRRAHLLETSRRLTDGVINPGGSKKPLTTSPVLNDPTRPDLVTTPGMGIRFREPVVNGPGPDVVFFDLQLIVYSPTGDAFHVSPLEFRPGLRSHTIWKYEIDMNSPESERLVPFRVLRFDRVPQSMSELLTAHHSDGANSHAPSKIIATGIDLSDLGYAPGERVNGLFFQDVLDDNDTIDPVFIGGFPPLPEGNR